jgi:hypothetical protein
MVLSCSNYYCECYKDNKCQRALEHRLKLFEKRLDDNHIPKRNNNKKCEMWIEPKGEKQ